MYNHIQSVAANRGSTSFALWCNTTGVVRELGRDVHLCSCALVQAKAARGEGSINGHMDKKGGGWGEVMVA